MKWSGILGLVAAVLMLAPAAQAGRSIRLMYEAPAATEGGPAVVVTYEEQRLADKGGKDPTLVANERGSYNIPLAVRSGKQGTGHAADVVPSWIVDVLKSAGYDASRGEAGEGPRLHAILKSMWGDQIQFPGGSRHQFSFQVELQIWPAGATEPAWISAVQAGGGTTTVITRFDDPVEAGFVRAFDEATATLVELMVSDEFQAALPGGNLAAAQAAAAALGPDPAGKKGAAAGGAASPAGEGADGGDSAGADGGGGSAPGPALGDDGVVLTEADLPKGFENWDPGTWQWVSAPDHTVPKETVVGFIVGGIGAGLFIGGDQWATSLAKNQANIQTLPAAGASLVSVDHIPRSAPNPDAEWIVQAGVSEIMVSYGMQMFVPTLALTGPTLAAGLSGANIQTTKAVMGIASFPAYLPAGFAMLARFDTLFAPHWRAHGTDQDRWVHMGTGLFPLVLGIVDIVIGSIQGVMGVLYAANVVTARADERGLFVMPTDGRRGLKNSAAFVMPIVMPTEDGVTFGFAGRF